MGDYYSLRFTAALTNEGAKRVRTLLHSGSWEGVHASFAMMERARFIPFGGLQNAPEGWEQAREVKDVHDVTTWHVCCSIKVGTDDTVNYFLQRVLAPLLLFGTKVEWWNELTGVTRVLLVHPDGRVVEVRESQAPGPS